MSARRCSECGGLVASTINVCPHCGHYMPAEGSTQQRANLGENPYTSLAWCIISLLFFWPLGIVAFIYYFKSDNCWNVGNQAGAEQYGKQSIRFARLTVWLFVITIVLGMCVPFCIVSMM